MAHCTGVSVDHENINKQVIAGSATLKSWALAWVEAKLIVKKIVQNKFLAA